MADDITPGEVYRRLQDHEDRTIREHTAMDGRLADLARETVPLRLYQDRETARDGDMKTLSDRVEKLEQRPAMSLTRWLAVLTVAAAFIALAIQAYGTLKGAQ